MIFNEKITPTNPPNIVPINPIINPIDKKILIRLLLLKPIVFKIPMSLFFSFTKIIKPEIIFIEATKIIKVSIRNITFFSTFNALINVELFSFHDEVYNLKLLAIILLLTLS